MIKAGARRDQALILGAKHLDTAKVPSARRDVAVLLQWVLSIDAATMLAYGDMPLSEGEAVAFGAAIQRRASREPVSHIVGGREFWGRWFEVTADVLDPRPETEILISAALNGPKPERVLDLGLGSGCILGTLLAEWGGASGVGVDLSEAALAVAGRNMDSLGVTSRVELQQGDWLSGVAGTFDLITCNPPYITEEEMAVLSPEVAGHEPHMALTPGGDGLEPYRLLAPKLIAYLNEGGRVLFEIGPKQAQDVSDIFVAAGWSTPEIHRDFDGRDRCLAFDAPNCT